MSTNQIREVTGGVFCFDLIDLGGLFFWLAGWGWNGLGKKGWQTQFSRALKGWLSNLYSDFPLQTFFITRTHTPH